MENIDDQGPGTRPESRTVLAVSPNDPPWNGWVAVAVWLLSIFFIVAVPSIFLFPYVFSRGIDLQDRQNLYQFIYTDQTAIILQLAPVIVAHILTLAVAWFAVTKFNRYSFRQTLGWDLNGFRVWHAVAITVCFYIVALLMTVAFGKVENDFDRLIASSRVAVYLVAFLATFTAPLVEEVIYRGLLYSAFQRRFGFLLAVIFVTLMFTAVHVPQYSQNSVPDYASVGTLLLLSLVLTLVRAGTGNLLPSILLHTIFNALQSLVLVFGPYLETKTRAPDPTGFIFYLFK